jgi:hypothetical protein
MISRAFYTLKVLQFPATATPETAEAQIDAIDDMREAAGRINDLRHERIEKIERDVRALDADVAALAQAIAPQLQGTDPEDALLYSSMVPDGIRPVASSKCQTTSACSNCAYSPKLNPAENIWQYLRQNQLSNRVFASYEAIVDACCDAWNALTAKRGLIHSIATRQWVSVNL